MKYTQIVGDNEHSTTRQACTIILYDTYIVVCTMLTVQNKNIVFVYYLMVVQKSHEYNGDNDKTSINR